MFQDPPTAPPNPLTSPAPPVTVISSSPKPPHSRKLLIFVSLAVLLIALPVSVFLVIQNRNRLKSDAHVWDGNAGQTRCGITFIGVTEAPSCPEIVPQGLQDRTDPQNRTNDVPSYQATYTFQNTDSVPHTVLYEVRTDFCLNAPYLVWDENQSTTNAGCWENTQSSQETKILQPGESFSVTASRSSPTGLSCGSFQTDFAILNVDDNPNPASCQFSDFSLTSTTVCETGTICTELPAPPESTPSATPIPEPTDKPIKYNITCNNSCGATDICESGLVCYAESGTCRKENNITDPTCGSVGPVSTTSNPPPPTATPIPQTATVSSAPTQLPESGVTDYTIFIALGALLIIGVASLLII